MKKSLLSIALLLSLLFFTACEADELSLDTTAEDVTEVETVDPAIPEINPENIQVNEVLGLNEQIYLSLGKLADGEYIVSYKAVDAAAYTVVDKELLLDEEDSMGCYILGLKEGDYSVRVECGAGESFSRVTLNDINVERQDRSGYAHFNYEEGIGGYNNDGTVKENAKILYVSNENKNTVTLDINGTTYTGLVEILKANAQMTEPLVIRVLDTITTNQWTPTASSQEIDYSAISEEYMKTLFSSEYGENLAGLPLSISGPDGTLYEYQTTPNGFSPVLIPDERNYYHRMMNTIDIEYASNITIEGVGTNAGFYQFGIVFLYSDSIEVRNITTDSHPVVALCFYAFGDATLHGRYWIHNNTFRCGYDAWSGVPGDETVALCDVHSTTISYNRFDKVGKTILMGGWEDDYQLNTTIHHNHYFEVTQRVPLSRNANIHNYNNYFDNCGRGLSPRTSSYVFSEGNYFKNVDETYYLSNEVWGPVKSWNDIYENCNATKMATAVEDREQIVKNTCSPDQKTDYSTFDTDPTLFYYDAENKCSDVELLHNAEAVPEFVPTYAGAGVLLKLELDD